MTKLWSKELSKLWAVGQESDVEARKSKGERVSEGGEPPDK
jgi:hypothetical protein